ncbi:MAG: prolipoprotein diacylglyceryl transferase [Clostridiales bacterium]|nr:prolipoprotein diacylglyceryl transferase [Clostridiales bacterium]
MNWYGFIIACGIVLCVVLAYFTAKHRGIEGDTVVDIIIFCLPLAIVFARIYYVVFDLINGGHWTFTRFIGADDKGLQGLAIYGGLIGAVIGAFLLSLWKKRKKNPENKRITFMQLLDLGFVFIILGQAIGRWGNFANEEAHGYMITDPSLMYFPMGVEINGIWYYATFFYESMWDLVGFGLLFFLYIGKHKSFDGFVFSCYCIYYGIGRVWIEGMRADSLWLVPPTVSGNGEVPDVGGLRVSQLVSILLIVFGVAYIVAHIIRARRAGKKVFIFARQDKLNDGYFEYDKTKLAHPMPDIKFWKDRHSQKDSGEEIIIDNNGVAIKVTPDEPENTGASETTAAEKPDASEKEQEKREKPKKSAEEAYEDRWDD